MIEESTIAVHRTEQGTVCELHVSARGSASHYARWALTDELAALLTGSESLGRTIAHRVVQAVLMHPESENMRREIRTMLNTPPQQAHDTSV